MSAAYYEKGRPVACPMALKHGGLDGVRDLGVIESAIARPRHLLNFGDPTPDMAALAATLAFGLAKNHGFVDGNKRTSSVATETFLALNGLKLTASDEEIVQIWADVGGWTNGRRQARRLATNSHPESGLALSRQHLM